MTTNEHDNMSEAVGSGSGAPTGDALPQLTEGFFKAINEKFDPAEPQTGVVQITSMKQFDSERGTRYRVTVSDGKNVQRGMLSSQLNAMVDSNELLTYTVFALKRYTLNNINDSKLLMVLDIDIISNTITEQIGNPVPLSDDQDAKPSSSSGPSNNSNNSSPISPSKLSPTKNASLSPTKLRQPNFAPIFDQRPPEVFPIISLNPYQSRWSIKARVTNKSEIRHWNNARGEGKLFSVDLIDESSEIKATAFNEIVDKFYDKLEVGKIYVISKGQVKTAKKQFTSIKNDYEITLDQSTTIEPAQDQSIELPTVHYSFVTLDKLPEYPKDTVIDIIAVVKETGDSTMLSTRYQKELAKRDLTVVDTSLKSIKLTIWGNMAETFDGSNNPIIVAKGVRISDYGGRSLSAVASSQIKINPDIVESHTLRGWFDSTGINSTFTSLSVATPSSFDDSQRKMVKDIELERLGTKLDTPDIFNIKATITQIPHEKPVYYTVCPETGSKVVQDSEGYYCEKTQKHMLTCDYKYILRVQAMDATGGLWLTGFNEQGVQILKKSAADLFLLRENGMEEEFDSTFTDATFKTFIFRLRAKAETYNGEQFTRHQILACKPLDYVADSKFLINAIKSY